MKDLRHALAKLAKRPGGSSAIRLNTDSVRRKENHALVSCVVGETRNYKYFTEICRGFLDAAKEKIFNLNDTLKILGFQLVRERTKPPVIADS